MISNQNKKKTLASVQLNKLFYGKTSNIYTNSLVSSKALEEKGEYVETQIKDSKIINCIIVYGDLRDHKNCKLASSFVMLLLTD